MSDDQRADQQRGGDEGRELDHLSAADRERLEAIERRLRELQLPEAFIRSALRSTAEVMRSLDAETDPGHEALRREEVQRFMAETGARPATQIREPAFKETRRVERERLLALIQGLIREARSAHARHEIKKTRNRLLKIDQRRLRRELGLDGEELCREINAILRAQAQRI